MFEWGYWNLRLEQLRCRSPESFYQCTEMMACAITGARAFFKQWISRKCHSYNYHYTSLHYNCYYNHNHYSYNNYNYKTTTATTIWLQLHYTNYITPQLQLHYATTTTTVAVHHTTSSSCGWGDHCNHCNHCSKHNSNHLSVNQWIRSAIRDSQQPTSHRFPILKLPPPPCAVLLVYWEGW